MNSQAFLPPERVEELKRLHTEYTRQANQLLNKALLIQRLIEANETPRVAA